MVETDTATCDKGGKFLTFQLAGEEYGIEIIKVREINGLMGITAVPQMPRYMKGVINLRGKVIPIVDLRLKFGLPQVEYTEQTCIIVVNVGKQIGIVVDTVSEVLDIVSENVEPPPSLGSTVDMGFILGMGKVGNGVKILLNIDQVLSEADIADITALAEADHGMVADE